MLLCLQTVLSSYKQSLLSSEFVGFIGFVELFGFIEFVEFVESKGMISPPARSKPLRINLSQFSLRAQRYNIFLLTATIVAKLEPSTIESWNPYIT